MRVNTFILDLRHSALFNLLDIPALIGGNDQAYIRPYPEQQSVCWR